MPDNPRRFLPTFSLRWLLGLVLFAAVLSFCGVLLQEIREQNRAAYHLNDLKQIGLGIQNYEQTFKRLPTASDRSPTGELGCSWRAVLIPYMESFRIRRDTTQPWTAPVNTRMRQCSPAYYCGSSTSSSAQTFWTKVVGISGPRAFFDDERSETLRADDAAPDLIIAVEVRDSGIHWMEPRDLDYRELVEREQSGDLKLGAFESSIGVLFLDGRAWRLRTDTPRDLLLKFMTIEGAKQNDAEALLGPYRLQ